MKKISIILVSAVCFFMISPTTASAQVSVGFSVSATIAPPELPVYTQPPCPADGYLWTPGYWAYADGGYFWVPGVWVRPPQIGYLWTPAYWGFAGGVYGFHAGYWGPHVGFYGGINYGYGYGGYGFGGGRWEGGAFRYNTAVVNVNTTVIHNTYVDRTVIVNHNTARTSFNGGPHGIAARPTAQEETFSRERHVQATGQQTSHMQTAARDRSQFASVNGGRPTTTAMNTVGGHRYDPHGNNAAAHAVNNHPATPHAQPAPNGHAMNHPATPHAQPAPNAHAMNSPANHHTEQGNPNSGNHPMPQHQQAYNNHQHATPQQHYSQPHPQQQHANPAPQHQGGAPHPKEH